MITHDDNATNWRELTDGLTAEKVAELTDLERQLGDEGSTPLEVSAIMLTVARDCVLHRTIDSVYADIPLPEGAADISGWEQNLKRDGWSRALVWRSFGDSEMSVDIDGRQECDGSYTRQISVWQLEDGGTYTGAGARRLAELLVEAADELDALNR